jgi:hypothetical protein
MEMYFRLKLPSFLFNIELKILLLSKPEAERGLSCFGVKVKIGFVLFEKVAFVPGGGLLFGLPRAFLGLFQGLHYDNNK